MLLALYASRPEAMATNFIAGRVHSKKVSQ